MKTCFKCNRSLPFDEFYRHPRMADGHLNKCKECTKHDVKRSYTEHHDARTAYEQKRLDDPARREKQREYGRKKRGTASHAEAATRWNSANAHKKHAHGLVQRAVETGRLTRQPCEVCGRVDSQAHHDDYDKPLDVRWLCPTHHGEIHRRRDVAA